MEKLRKIETITPSILKSIIKKTYWKIVRTYNKYKYIKKGRFVEFGYRFRFTRIKPNNATIGERTIIEEFNVWNAKRGNIVVGNNCWFGLHNIIMGPVKIGDGVSTGPYVCLLGPRHAMLNNDEETKEMTKIGNNVWISTGSIIFHGVKIGDNVIIGPGSVVSKDVPANAYVAGNPARNLTKISEISWKRS